MQRRHLGTSGLEISRIGLGTWAIGGHMWGGQDDAESLSAIHAAIDHGVNWIDSAPIYGSGHSEEIIGHALKQLPSSRRPLIFTKFGLGTDSDTPTRSASAAEVASECEASLRRLGVDHIDLYQLHWPAPQPVTETAAACDALLKAGKIRAIGVSNFSVPQLEEWRATGVPLHSDQPPFSILRPAVKHDVLPWCSANEVGVISVLATLPRHALRHVADRQDVSSRRRPKHAQGLLRRALSATPPGHRRAARACRARRPEHAATLRRGAPPHAGPDRRDRRRPKRQPRKPDRQSCRRPQQRSGVRGVGNRRQAGQGSRNDVSSST